jgi:hypothetical protein
MLAFYIATSVGVKNIQENWPEYRCNPLYMPFASTLAPVPTTARENFSYCLSDYMKSAGPALTQPISYVQSATLALMGTMTESNEKSAEQQSDFSHSVNDLFKGLFSVIGGMIAQFNIMLIKIIDIQGKMMASVTVVMYLVSTVQYTFMSMWNGIPGGLIRFMGKK